MSEEKIETPVNQDDAPKIQIQIPMEELKKRSLFLATPMYGGQCAGMYARSVADLSAACQHYGIKLQMYFLFNESLITRARNYCMDEFDRSECSHMIFIDSDIGFSAQDVIALLALSSEDSDFDIIGGPYPKKCISWEKIKTAVDQGLADEDPNNLERYIGDYVFNPKSGTNRIPIHQPVEVLEIGTGFMMFRKNVLQKFKDKYPHMWYKPDHVRTEHFDGSREIMSYFDCVIDRGYDMTDIHNLLKDLKEGKIPEEKEAEVIQSFLDREKVNSKRYLSEDYKFCQDAGRAGLKIWLCPWMRTTHVGSYNFGGSMADLAALGVSATADVEQLKKYKDKKRKVS